MPSCQGLCLSFTFQAAARPRRISGQILTSVMFHYRESLNCMVQVLFVNRPRLETVLIPRGQHKSSARIQHTRHDDHIHQIENHPVRHMCTVYPLADCHNSIYTTTQCHSYLSPFPLSSYICRLQDKYQLQFR